MADTAYTYSISTDFSSGVAPAKFEDEVIALGLTSANYLYIEIDEDTPDDCEVWFDDPLSGADETSLDGAVAAHDGVPYQDVEKALEAVSLENTYLQYGGSSDEKVQTARDADDNMVLEASDKAVIIPSASGEIGLEIGDTIYAIQLGLDSGGTAFFRRKGSAGTLRFGDNADNPQMLFGSNSTDAGALYLDADCASGGVRPMRLNTLIGAGEGAPVYVGSGGYAPLTNGNTPLGSATERFQRAWTNHLVGDVDVFSGTGTLDDASMVVAQDGTYTLTLPTAAKGWWYVVERQGATGTVTLAPGSGDTINGGGSTALTSNTTYLVFAEDATDWRVVPFGGAPLSDTAPVDVTTTAAAAGSATEAARRDHKHDIAVKLDDLNTPDDNTDLNATTSAHGLLPKLSGTNTEFLDGTGAWSTPADPIFGSEYDEASSEGESSTTSSSYQQKLRLTTSSLPAGDYRIEWFFEHAMSGDDKEFGFRVQVDDTTTLSEGIIVAKGKYSDDIWRPVSGWRKATLTAAAHNIDIDYNAGSDTAYIRRARAAIWRVPA